MLSQSNLACEICFDLLKTAIMPAIGSFNGHHFPAVIQAIKLVMTTVQAKYAIHQHLEKHYPNIPWKGDPPGAILERIVSDVLSWLTKFFPTRMCKMDHAAYVVQLSSSFEIEVCSFYTLPLDMVIAEVNHV